MANPLSKLKKLRSLDEVITRGGQALSVYREQKKAGVEPTDEDLIALIDKEKFGDGPVIAEGLWQKFYTSGVKRFFPVFRESGAAIQRFRTEFGEKRVADIIARAETIVAGRYEILGLRNLYLGTEIDWHCEPLTSKRSPLKHWKEFDELDTTETGNKKIVWEINRHQHFFILGAAYLLTRDERYARTFCDQLSSWMDQNPPGMGINWSSSLEVAMRAMSWVWAFHMFRNSDSFTPELFRRALKFIHVHGRHIERYLSKYYSPNTHLTGEALGLYYVGTQFPFFERSPKWQQLGEDILFDEITRQVHQDGVYFEQSTWYQRYTVDIYTHFSILRALIPDAPADPRTPDLADRFEAASDLLMHLTMPDGSTPLIGDDDGGRMLPITSSASDDFRGSLAVTAILFDRPDHKALAGRSSEELFWLLGTAGLDSFKTKESSEPKGTSTGFRNGGYFAMRDGWGELDSCLVVDCGDLGALSAGHGHADALSFVAAVHGRPLLVDSGTYTYHESKELRDYFRSTSAHNTLEVDGRPSSEPAGPFSWHSKAEAFLNNWVASDRFDLFEGHHNGYRRLEDPVIHHRSILGLKGDYWILRDLAEAKERHRFVLNFHFAANVEARIDNRQVIADGHTIVTFDNDGHWEERESWISTNHANKVNAPLMRYVTEGTGTQEFFTFLLPAASGETRVEEVSMAGGRAFIINYNGYTDLFALNDEPGKLIDTGIFTTDFKYTWARMSPGEALPDEIVCVHGMRLKLQNTSVFGPGKVAYASIRRLGRDLMINREGSRSSRPID